MVSLVTSPMTLLESSVNLEERTLRIWPCLVSSWAELKELVDEKPLAELSLKFLMENAITIMNYDTNLAVKPNTKLPETQVLRIALVCLLVTSRHFKKLPITSLDDLRKLYSTIDIPDTQEFDLLAEFASVVHLLVQVMPARINRRRILELASRVTEGKDAKRVMGGGAKALTLIRDQIICVEGGVAIVPRAPRACNRRRHNSSDSDDGGETSPEDSSNDDLSVATFSQRRKRTLSSVNTANKSPKRQNQSRIRNASQIAAAVAEVSQVKSHVATQPEPISGHDWELVLNDLITLDFFENDWFDN